MNACEPAATPIRAATVRERLSIAVESSPNRFLTGAARLALEAARRAMWDVIVVGAGPAGAMAARHLARTSASVLLVDKARFPRDKVCGCCLNGNSLAALERAGLDGLPARLGASRLDAFHIAARGRRATLALPGGAAVSRSRLDAALVAHAVRAGAHFLPETIAVLGRCNSDHRLVVLRGLGQAEPAELRARVVLAADGLASRLLDGEPHTSMHVARDPRIGVAAILDTREPAYQSGTIYMACTAGGYCGLVRLEDGRLDVAAALAPGFIRDAGGPGRAVARVLDDAGLEPLEDVERARWRGTPTLTRRRSPPGGERVLALGDAAGYVEPFTGEGMAWALGSAAAVTPLVTSALSAWRPETVAQWQNRLHELAGGRRRACRFVTRMLRYPRLVAAAVAMLNSAPALARPFIRGLNRPFAPAAVTTHRLEADATATASGAFGPRPNTSTISSSAPVPASSPTHQG